MAASIFDSAMYRDMLFDRDFAALFTDTAEVRAMMIVTGALAKAQGELHLIPHEPAKAIHRASLELQIDPVALSALAKKTGSIVPGMIAHFRDLMQAPEYAIYLQKDATNDDIQNTALALRLRQVLALIEGRLASHQSALAADLPTLRDRLLTAQLTGAHLDLHTAFARGLGLSAAAPDPQALPEFAAWLVALTTECAWLDDPIGPELARIATGLEPLVTPQGGLATRLALPQLILCAGRALAAEV